jgi:predicted ribosome quality control (RQC) complex YloA/Tae2 family protein
LHNLDLNENDALDDNNKKLIECEFGKFSKSLKVPVYNFYEKESKSEILLIKFNHIQTYNLKSFTNINELLSEYIKNFYKVETRKTVKDRRLVNLQNKIDIVDKKILGLMKQIEVSKQSEQYFIYGEHILSNLQYMKKGEKELQVKDKSTGDVIIIKLDESLTPSDNAQKYFKKYKGQKDSLKVLKEKVNIFKKEKEKLSNELERLSEIQDYKTLSKMNKKQEIKEKADKETSMFRKFILSDVFEVWVGKDSKSNDLLTTKFSSPNDLWFHVRGASGSHTVLKITNKKIIISKQIIQSTASIAAYYSKARNASNVPVAYCERKYVKKKKGFRQGSVVMAREKVIFVKPALPESTEQ